jgi:hypothetical protein
MPMGKAVAWSVLAGRRRVATGCADLAGNLPSLQDPKVIKQKFPKGFTTVTPSPRLTPQPKKA